MNQAETAALAAPEVETNPLELERDDLGYEKDVDWADVSESEDAEEPAFDEGDEVVEDKATPAEGTPVEPAAKEEVPATPAVVPEAKLEPAAPVAPVAPAVPTPAPKGPLTPEEFKAEETRIFGELEKLYGMSDEEAQGFLTEPELVLPKTAARLHMNITKDVIGGVQSILPQLIQQYMHNNSAEQNARTAFQAVNPDLADPQYEEYIFRVGKLFREVNPNAPADVAIKQIGDMVRQALNLPNPNIAKQEQVVPTAPVQAVPAPKPFSPARGGSGGAPVKETNPWADLAGDRDEMF